MKGEVTSVTLPQTKKCGAMTRLMKDQSFNAVEYAEVPYDGGDKISLLRANVALALKRPDLGDVARQAIQGLL